MNPGVSRGTNIVAGLGDSMESCVVRYAPTITCAAYNQSGVGGPGSVMFLVINGHDNVQFNVSVTMYRPAGRNMVCRVLAPSWNAACSARVLSVRPDGSALHGCVVTSITPSIEIDVCAVVHNNAVGTSATANRSCCCGCMLERESIMLLQSVRHNDRKIAPVEHYKIGIIFHAAAR